MAKLLCVGDIHLGRRTAVTGLPPGTVDLSLITVQAAWANTVVAAIERQVDAVVLAGDVVDDDDAVLETLYPFEAGVQNLVGAGIQVIAVAGNHDTRALPRVANMVKEFTILGRGGQWQLARVPATDGFPVDILGWSFVDKLANTNPTGSLDEETRAAVATSDVPVIGLLHGDIDKPTSGCGRATRADLAAVPVVAWLMGHIHAADIRPGGVQPIGYLGSLQGLDPTETGPHGPWLVEVGADRRVTMEQLPIAGVVWRNLRVEVSGCNSVQELQDAVAGAIGKMDPEPSAKLVGVRANLVGRIQHPALLAEAFAAGVSIVRATTDGTPAFVDKVRWGDVRSQHDLAAMASKADPPGSLASLLLALGNEPSPVSEDEPLIARMTQIVEKEMRLLPRVHGGEARALAIEILRSAGQEALDRLLATKGDK